MRYCHLLLTLPRRSCPCPTPQIAKRQAVVNPENTFFSVKRFIGRRMAEVQGESTQVRLRHLQLTSLCLAP